MSMRTLLIGNMTFYHIGAISRSALQALGQPNGALDQNANEPTGWPPLVRKVAARLMGRRPLGFWRFNRDILAAARNLGPDMVLVTGGAPVAGSTLRLPVKVKVAEEFRKFSCDVVLVGGGDGDRRPCFEALVRAVPGPRLRLYSAYWDRMRGRPRLLVRPRSGTGDSPPYGILGEAMETPASFEA